MSDEDREVRTLRWQNKQLGKQLGRAGATIYQLRNEVAALRQMGSVFRPGDYQRLLNQLRDSEAEKSRLVEKLRAKEEAK